MGSTARVACGTRSPASVGGARRALRVGPLAEASDVAAGTGLYSAPTRPAVQGADAAIGNDSRPLFPSNSDGSFRYTPNGSFTGTDWFTYYADDGYLQDLATVFLTVDDTPGDVHGDLDVVKFDGTDLEDEKEQSPGGFVVFNNDNDDYQFWPDGSQMLDYEKDGPIQGEHDLVPLHLHPIDPLGAGGTYRLRFTSENIRIWQYPDKTVEVFGDSTPFDATQDTLVYVEGVGVSDYGAQERVDLTWYENANAEGEVLDAVNLTAYQASGPMNVPGFSVYNYKAKVAGGGMAQGGWTASDGTVTEGANTNSAKIRWNSGPVVGKAIFTPVEGLGFKSEREVNVVLIELAVNDLSSPAKNLRRPGAVGHGGG